MVEVRGIPHPPDLQGNFVTAYFDHPIFMPDPESSASSSVIMSQARDLGFFDGTGTPDVEDRITMYERVSLPNR